MPIRDSHGRIIRWIGTNTDIHDQKLALLEREALLKAEQQLRLNAEKASREKDEFLAVVSHELRNPLNAVLGWAHLLNSDAQDEDQRALARQKIESNAHALADMIGELLDASRIISDKLKIEKSTLDLSDPLRDALESVRSAAESRQIELVCDLPRSAVPVLGDARRLQQVFANLLNNAIKFSASNQQVHVSIATDEGFATAIVRDEGEGIDPAFMPKLFTQFSQADASTTRRHGGLGLGLYTAKHLIQMHGGVIHAESAGRGRGATFMVRLPAATQRILRPTPPPIHEVAVSLIGINVLALDDDPEACDLLTSVLLSRGATVTAVGSVAKVLETLRYGLPEVILSDLSMPEVDGYGLIDRLRSSTNPAWRSLPVIAVTALASEQERVKALSRGFTAYLTKPLDVPLLCRTIVDLVRTRLMA